MNIICIEDNHGDFYLIEKILNQKIKNAHITKYRYLNDFLETDQPYDLIITDLTLPDAYGPEVVRRIRKVTGKPIIVFSGVGGKNLSQSILKTIQNVGATLFLSKHKDGIQSLPKALESFITA